VVGASLTRTSLFLGVLSAAGTAFGLFVLASVSGRHARSNSSNPPTPSNRLSEPF
jgi:hypothetical protein